MTWANNFSKLGETLFTDRQRDGWKDKQVHPYATFDGVGYWSGVIKLYWSEIEPPKK